MYQVSLVDWRFVAAHGRHRRALPPGSNSKMTFYPLMYSRTGSDEQSLGRELALLLGVVSDNPACLGRHMYHPVTHANNFCGESMFVCVEDVEQSTNMIAHKSNNYCDHSHADESRK